MEKLKVLVVDDESRMRKLVSDFLTKKDFVVVEAGDGEEAVDLFFEQKDISLIIMDVMMPKMDGWEAVKTIRQYSQVPIIMLTAKSGGAGRASGIRAGSGRVYFKALQPEDPGGAGGGALAPKRRPSRLTVLRSEESFLIKRLTR